MKQQISKGWALNPKERLEGVIPSHTCNFTKLQMPFGSLCMPSVGLHCDMVWQLSADG